MAKNGSTNSWHQKRTGKKQLSVPIFSYDNTFLGTQVKLSHQFLNRYWVGNAKVQLMFPGYWVLGSEIWPQLLSDNLRLRSDVLRKPLYLAFGKTKQNKKTPSLFLDNPNQEKNHSHRTFSFPFLSLQRLHKYK